MSWEKVRKRNGELEDFSPAKITKAIYKALSACGKDSKEEAEKLTQKVLEILPEKAKSSVPGGRGNPGCSRRSTDEGGITRSSPSLYSLPRKRRKLREAKQKLFGVKDDLKLSLNAIQVLQEQLPPAG